MVMPILVSGGKYTIDGEISISRKIFNPPITITGKFTKVAISESEGIILDSFTLNYPVDATTTTASQAIRLNKSKKITVIGGIITGGISPTNNLPTARAILADTCEDITIVYNRVTKFHKGFTFANSVRLKIVTNAFDTLRTTPISGGGCTDIQIVGNIMGESNPSYLTGDHADEIHFWTGVGKPCDDILIQGNIRTQGKGASMLGIHLDDNANKAGFHRVKILDNIIEDSDGQGIRLENIHDFELARNLLLDSGGGDPIKDSPRVFITKWSSNGTIHDNVTCGIDLEDDPLYAVDLATIKLMHNEVRLFKDYPIFGKGLIPKGQASPLQIEIKSLATKYKALSTSTDPLLLGLYKLTLL